MNAPVTALKSDPAVVNETLIRGKIVEVVEWESGEGFSTEVRLPAVNEYESAATVEISSRRKIGKVDEVVKIPCRIGGFKKRGTSATSGKAYSFITVRLFAVED